MIATLSFLAVSACILLAAVFVVRSSNLVRAALWLGAALVATAVLYAMLGASFLAGIQVLLYVGGVVTLMIFGVMMTRRHEGFVAVAEARNQTRGVVAAGGFFAVMAAAIRGTEGLDGPPDAAPPASLTSADLGRALLVDHVLAFEVVSVLLLGAIIGATVLARRRDPGAESQPAAPAPDESDNAAQEASR